MKRMSKYNEPNIGKIIKPINIPGIISALSQFSVIYDSKMMKEISDIAKNPILTETQKMLDRYNKMMEPLRMSAYFSKINEVTASISNLSPILQEAGNKSLISQILKYDSAFSALSEKTLEDINMNLLGRVTDQVFSESEEWNIDTMSETIASEYKKATNLSLNKKSQDSPIEAKRTIDVKEIREWLNFIIAFISFVLGITNSSATTINNYNYTQQVNNYYVVGMGYDAKELNMTKYRIVNRESIVRLKHDCHSIVIEKLEEGQIVRIINKYKKWRQIIWENEDGEEYMGWIQNYKLTEFKVPRNK